MKQHQGWCCFVFGICGRQREDADHETTCCFVVSMCGRAKKRRRTRNHTLLGVVSCSACGRACVEDEEKTLTTNEGVVRVRHVWEDEEKTSNTKSHPAWCDFVSACVGGQRKDVDHETTPTRVCGFVLGMW